MSEEKTHPPTERRLQKARDDGRVAVSRELSMLVSLSAGTLAIAAGGKEASITAWLAASLQQTHYTGISTWQAAAHSVMLAVLPPACAAAGGYAAATLLQTQFMVHTASLQPDISRLSPLAGIKRMFGPQALTQLVRALAKLTVLCGCLYAAFRSMLPSLPIMPWALPQSLYAQILAHGGRLLMLLLGGQTVIAGIDLFWERRRHARQLRMSFQELRDEHKESEGNPQIKGRLRQLARSRAGRRMMQAVPKAAVIITNPTHFAVALTYEQGSQGAPRLVAKGADEVASRIRELARQHRVPIVANPPLARALYRIEFDTEIPAEHFKAVAEIIAYVWRMREQALRR